MKEKLQALVEKWREANCQVDILWCVSDLEAILNAETAPLKGTTTAGRAYSVWPASIRANGWQPHDQPHPAAYLPHRIDECEVVELADGAAVVIAPDGASTSEQAARERLGRWLTAADDERGYDLFELQPDDGGGWACTLFQDRFDVEIADRTGDTKAEAINAALDRAEGKEPTYG